MSDKITKYNVWVHVEGVNREDDVIDGEVVEPHLLESFKKPEDADALILKLDDAAGGREPADVMLDRTLEDLLAMLD